MRLGVLISGNGTNLKFLLDQQKLGKLPEAEFVCVATNNPAAAGLQWAKEAGVPVEVLRSKEFAGSREEYDEQLLAKLKPYDCEGLILAGYMRLVSPEIIKSFPHRMINLHPALLPSFPGKNGAAQAIEYGVKITGCTVHFVDAGMDTGPIILQSALDVHTNDSAETLSARLRPLEHATLANAVNLFTQRRLTVVGRKVVIHDTTTN
ncbi:MAG: phosphoribosylglycinamide formyltransferase [Sumerlaeia bacterium]